MGSILKSEWIKPHRDAAGYGFQTRRQAQQALAWLRANGKQRHWSGVRMWFHIELHDRNGSSCRPWGIYAVMQHRDKPSEPMGRIEHHNGRLGEAYLPNSRVGYGFEWFTPAQRTGMALQDDEKKIWADGAAYPSTRSHGHFCASERG